MSTVPSLQVQHVVKPKALWQSMCKTFTDVLPLAKMVCVSLPTSAAV